MPFSLSQYLVFAETHVWSRTVGHNHKLNAKILIMMKNIELDRRHLNALKTISKNLILQLRWITFFLENVELKFHTQENWFLSKHKEVGRSRRRFFSSFKVPHQKSRGLGILIMEFTFKVTHTHIFGQNKYSNCLAIRNHKEAYKSASASFYCIRFRNIFFEFIYMRCAVFIINDSFN